nr:hypothetical protein [uncultured Bdellovibrio sp.]
MKASLVTLLVMIGLLTMGFTSKAKAEIDMSEPPFWMPSYEEFNDLQPAQKDFYLEKFMPLVAKVPGLEKLSKEKMKDATEWFQTWNSVRRKLYEACQDSSIHATCEEIADVRIDALNMFANQKQENRLADREAAKEKEKKKKK